MGVLFSSFEDTIDEMSPNLRSQKREVQNSEPKPSIDTMTMKTIEKELKKHGVNAVDVLRNKLKELTDEEAPVVADTNPATKSAPAKSRGNTDDVMELPVPLIAEEIPVRLTRSRVGKKILLITSLYTWYQLSK